MKYSRLATLVLSTAVIAACTTQTREQLDTLAHADSIRVDSLSNVRKDLLNEVMASTEFVSEINTELAKARSLQTKASMKLDTPAESLAVNEQRKQIVARISHLVARLDSVQTRLASTRAHAGKLAKEDSALLTQVAEYQKSIADLQASAEKQKSDFQAVIDQQKTQIASLNGQVDTLTHVRVALTDTVGQLTTEKNTAYYVVGTRDELIKKGVLVAEGQKRFLLVGSRNIKPARQLDPSSFTKIDRLSDRTISLPAGQYEIYSRQDTSFVAPQSIKDGKIVGALTIDKPEQFWAPSRYLIIVKS